MHPNLLELVIFIDVLFLLSNLKKKKIKSVFISQSLDSDLQEIIKSKGHIVHLLKQKKKFKNQNFSKNHFLPWKKKIQLNDSLNTLKVLDNFGIDKLIVDHYALGATWQKKICSFKKLIVVDDLNIRKNFCDLYINYNTTERKNKLKLKKESKSLLGIKNLICNEIYNLKKNTKTKTKNSIFVNMGFADKNNFTFKILEILKKQRFKNFKIKVFSRKKFLFKKYKKYKNIAFFFKPKKNLKNIYFNSKLILSSAGMSMYEQILCMSNSIFFPQNFSQEKICQNLNKLNLINYEKKFENFNELKIEKYLSQKKPKKKLKENNKKVAKIILTI